MSLSVHASPWAPPEAALDELRLCLDRSSDSDSQLELNHSLTELIESITCKDDSGDEVVAEDSVLEGRVVVAGIVECILDRVEATTSARPRVELVECEIDDEGSRDNKSYQQKVDGPKKALRRKRDRDETKKSRRRSTSCSTTSSVCSGSDVSRKHRRKHKHHRRIQEDPSPRVNPIFLWVKQDDTRIVEVLCEDYDKRNRIRLTKTAHGWRATPRTERLDSALSRSSLDLSPTTENPPPLVPPTVKKEFPETKEKKKPKRCASRKSKKRCDKRKDKGFKNKTNYVDEYKNVDVVNNNYSNISNNNSIKVENNRLASEPSISEPSLRSFGYKKACHGNIKLGSKIKKKDNNRSKDIDVYTFVDTPKTESEDYGMDDEFESAQDSDVDLKIKPDPDSLENVVKESENNCETSDVKPELKIVKCKIEKQEECGESTTLFSNEDHIVVKSNVDRPPSVNNDECSHVKEIPTVEIIPVKTEENCDISTDKTPEVYSPHENIVGESPNISLAISKDVDLNETKKNVMPQEECSNLKPVDHPDTHLQPEEIENKVKEVQSEASSAASDSSQDEQAQIALYANSEINPEEIKTVDSGSANETKIDETRTSEVTTLSETMGEYVEEDVDEEPPPEIILPEPHLQTPEPSPQPVPEPSTKEADNRLGDISLQPDTSLDSDTIHLPDTTTKSDTSTLINNNISLGEKLLINPRLEITKRSSLLSEVLHPESKSIEQDNGMGHHSHTEIKTAEMLRQAEIERQITADLDEDHLLAIEEILQGEECVDDFDDLPEEYPGSHESPVNLVIDLKAKDQVDNSGIPLSLRTDDFLDMLQTPPPLKDHNEILPAVSTPKKALSTEKPIPPAHQQSKTKFLESILSCPKRHKENGKVDSSDQKEPLYLGVSRKSASPTVSSSDGRKFSSPDLEPKPKRMKVEDITLKTILNRNKEPYPKTKVNKTKDSEETQQTADSTTKSRLLELLTNENDEHISKMDPLTQLKEVLSDPDLNVPDPLLVPRARLPALVANPAKEIPRLLSMKSENLSYPKLLTDPDLLVVSLSHLQSLLQAAGKEEEILKYQQHAQLLQQQMKQEQSSLDAATATALNQMMWLPYLSQLEAAAMACGNTQDFMTMLNMVFPPGSYSQMNPYMMTPTSPGINAYDYKSQLEFQQAFALWNEAMMQAATNQFAAQSLASNNSSNNISSKLYQNYQETKYNPKSHSSCTPKHQEAAKHTSARTSPITLNYQQNNKYRSSQFPYTSMFSIPTSTPTTSLPSSSSHYRSTPSSQSHSHQSYQNNRQRGYNYSNYASMRPPSVSSSLTVPKSEPSISSINNFDYFSKSQHKHANNSTNNTISTKSLMNILTKPKQTEVKSHHVSKAYPTSTTMLPKDTTIRMTSVMKEDPPKLKVKQPQHLVDPNSRPKLLNFEEHHAEVGSTTGALTPHPHVDEAHPNLWHPLFSSHQQKTYSSPWQWTTPVTVSGE